MKNSEFKISLLMIFLGVAFVCIICCLILYADDSHDNLYLYIGAIISILYIIIVLGYIQKISYFSIINYPLFVFNIHIGFLAIISCIPMVYKSAATGFMVMLYFPVFVIIMIISLIFGIKNDIANYKKRKNLIK